MKRKIDIIFADSIDDLNIKSIGLYHDHCYHLFRGKTIDIIDNFKYQNLMKDIKEYCLIYEEDIPYKIIDENE